MAAIKKSQLYSSLWESSDALRGGMDASQYKDYILTLLFVKYVTDKFKDEPYADIIVPNGGSFDDMVAIIGDKEKSKNIGEEMDKIIAKLAEANDLRGVIDNAHFNDEMKLGKGQEMVDKLIKLIKGINCYVNLIPMNSTINQFTRSTQEKMNAFYETLVKSNINVTLRREQGHDIDAACGQLRIKKMQGDICED